MRPLDIVVGGLANDFGAGVVEIEEEVSLSTSSRKRSVKPFCIAFPDAMKCQSMTVSLLQASMALQVNSVPWSDTIMGCQSCDDRRQFAGERAVPRSTDLNGAQAFLGHVVDDVEDAGAPPVGELVVDESSGHWA